MSNTKQVGEVILTGVRLSYPQLWVPKSIQGGEPMYGMSLLLSKTDDAEQILACRKAMTEVAQAKWGAQIPKLTSDRLALRDGGDEKHIDVDGYGPDIMYISCNSKKAFPVVDKNPKVVLNRETGSKVYAGCYVNAKIRFWVQDNSWGKRINCQPVALQFVEDGEAFGEAPVKADEVFDDLSGGESIGGNEAAFGGDEQSGNLLG